MKAKKTIDQNLNLKHVAFIMDGNGRWAKKRLLPRFTGHRAGIKAVQAAIESALFFGIPYITFYAFSTENWKRPKAEIDELFKLFREYLNDNNDDFFKRDIRVKVLGDINRFPSDMVTAINDSVSRTKDCKTLCVCFAFNYGARPEILRAAKRMSETGDTDFSEENFKKYLYTDDVPDPDIIVRTSGEQRLSNFLLFQAAYSELYFTKTFWPDFDRKEFEKVLNSFKDRERRFGSV